MVVFKDYGKKPPMGIAPTTCLLQVSRNSYYATGAWLSELKRLLKKLALVAVKRGRKRLWNRHELPHVEEFLYLPLHPVRFPPKLLFALVQLCNHDALVIEVLEMLEKPVVFPLSLPVCLNPGPEKHVYLAHLHLELFALMHYLCILGVHHVKVDVEMVEEIAGIFTFGLLQKPPPNPHFLSAAMEPLLHHLFHVQLFYLLVVSLGVKKALLEKILVQHDVKRSE